VPAFFYTFNHLGYGGPQLMQVCVATSLATIVFTSVRSVLAHNRKGAVDWDILRSWAPYIVGGAILGVLAASSLKSIALQAIFGAMGLIVGLYMTFGRADWRLGAAMPTGVACQIKQGVSPIEGSTRASSSRARIGMVGYCCVQHRDGGGARQRLDSFCDLMGT
jgi:uncharacterized membrane protein YfcA